MIRPSFTSSIRNNKPYVPKTLSEIYDQLGSMMLHAPTFIDDRGIFPERDVDTEFSTLVDGFGLVRKKLGEERYTAVINLCARAKALFVADPDETNGQSDQGIALLYEIEEIVQAARSRRVKATLKDGDGEISGD